MAAAAAAAATKVRSIQRVVRAKHVLCFQRKRCPGHAAGSNPHNEGGGKMDAARRMQRAREGEDDECRSSEDDDDWPPLPPDSEQQQQQQDDDDSEQPWWGLLQALVGLYAVWAWMWVEVEAGVCMQRARRLLATGHWAGPETSPWMRQKQAAEHYHERDDDGSLAESWAQLVALASLLDYIGGMVEEAAGWCTENARQLAQQAGSWCAALSSGTKARLNRWQRAAGERRAGGGGGKNGPAAAGQAGRRSQARWAVRLR